MGWLLVGLALGIAIGFALVSRRERPKFLASAEYWVYLPGETMPTQDTIMDRMLRNNPYARRGRSPLGPAEGLVFSDVRLHIALLLKAKNPHIFRPDLFEDHIVPTAETLSALADAQSLVKLRYVSEEPLPDKRHLQFLVHAADAVAGLGDGRVIFDQTAERLIDRADLQRALEADPDATRAEMHTQIVWREGHAETRGLAKIGVRDLATKPMEADERVLITEVMEAAVGHVWGTGTLPATMEVSAFDDTFRLQPEDAKAKKGPTTMKILRVRTA